MDRNDRANKLKRRRPLGARRIFTLWLILVSSFLFARLATDLLAKGAWDLDLQLLTLAVAIPVAQLLALLLLSRFFPLFRPPSDR